MRLHITHLEYGQFYGDKPPVFHCSENPLNMYGMGLHVITLNEY